MTLPAHAPDDRAWGSPVVDPVELRFALADTPFMAYDLTRVATGVHRFQEAFAGRVAVRYAVKCNPDPRVLWTAADAGAGFEVASLGELELLSGLELLDAPNVLYSNPVKAPAHVAGAFDLGVRRFAVDSREELEKLSRWAPGSEIYVRVRVDDSSSRFPLSSKFGVGHDEARRLLSDAPSLGLVPAGLTFHVGSQCTDVDAWAHAVSLCGPVMTSLLKEGIRLCLLDLGGGFPAHYGNEDVPELGDIAAGVLTALEGLPYLPEDVVCEPGRAIVAEAATLATSVIGRAERNGRPWVYLDVGAYNGLMECAQTMGRMHLPLRTDRPTGALVRCTVTGPSCDSSDTLFQDAALPADLEVGDRVYVGSAGAYSLCYAAPFNGFPVPVPVYL